MGSRGPTTITGDAARRGQRSEPRASAALLSLAPPRPHQRPVGPRLHLRSRPDRPSRPSSRPAPAPSPTATSTWCAAAAKKRADQLRDESKAAEAELEELQTWARDEAADPAHVVDRGAAPQAVREALAALAALPEGPLPTIREADGVTSRVDWEAALGVPKWAGGAAVSGRPSPAERRPGE